MRALPPVAWRSAARSDVLTTPYFVPLIYSWEAEANGGSDNYVLTALVNLQWPTPVASLAGAPLPTLQGSDRGAAGAPVGGSSLTRECSHLCSLSI